jgi:manganese/iron transport system substrate-binding protein
LRLVMILVVASLLAAGCGDVAGEEGGKVRVSATISVLADMVERVGGDRAEVHTIVEPGADVHTFQPSPSDAREISRSRVVFENGMGLEGWLEDLIQSAGGEDATVVELSEGIEAGVEEAHHEEHAREEHAHEEEHGHEHEDGNPHLWLDVENARRYVEKIRDALVEADRDGAEEYRANATEYLEELEELDGYIREKAGSIPEEDKKLVTFHDAFPHFAEAYGFEMIGVVIQNPEDEPSSREVARVVREIEEADVPAVFTEPQFSRGLAETVAREADVEVYELYSDSLTDEPGAGSYEEMMRTNIDRIAEALG